MHLILQFILTIAIVVLLPSFHSTLASFSLASTITSSYPISRASLDSSIRKDLCAWSGDRIVRSLQVTVGLDLIVNQIQNSSNASESESQSANSSSSVSLSFLWRNYSVEYEVPITDNVAIFDFTFPSLVDGVAVQVSLPRSTSPSLTVDLWRFNCSFLNLNLSADANSIHFTDYLAPGFYPQVVSAGTQSQELARIATDFETVNACCASADPAMNITIEYGGAMKSAYTKKFIDICLTLPFVSLSTPCRILASNNETKDVNITSFILSFRSVSPYTTTTTTTTTTTPLSVSPSTTTNPYTLPSSSPFVLSTTALILIIVFSIVGVIAVLSVLAFMWIKRRQFCPGLCRNSDLEASDASMIGPYSSVNNSTDP